MSRRALSSYKSLPIPFGKYQLVQLLGRGGMAEVWKAKMLGPGGFARTLVIKRILSSLCNSPDFLQMFTNEARLSAQLDHPNIVHVTEFGEVDGQYFIAMEYVRGRDLVDIFAAYQALGPMPCGMAAFIARDVARALAYAHSLTDEDGAPMGLIHRDVTPGNIMVGYSGAVKLVDFGIAKALAEAPTTQAGIVKGKVSYMSPEQNEGGAIDHRSDLFSLGVTLHEMLTGRRLFPELRAAEAVDRHRRAVPEPPSRSNPEVPAALDEICARALAVDRDQRFQDGRELAMALEEVVHATKWSPERLAATLSLLFPSGAEPSSIEGAAAVAGAPTRRMPASVGTRVVPGAMAPRRRLRGFVTAGLVALGSFGLAAGLSRLARDSSRQAAAAPASAPSRSVLIHVQTAPAGAEVRVAGETAPRGTTPLDFELARGASSVRLTLTLPNHAPRVVEVTPERDAQLHVTLGPAAPPHLAAHVAAPARAPQQPHHRAQRIAGTHQSRTSTPQ